MSEKISAKYSSAYRFLKAAYCSAVDIREAAIRYVDKDSFASYFKLLSEKTLGEKKSADGKVFLRFLSGITPKGFVTFKDTIYTLCSNVFVIRDKYGIGAPAFEFLKSEALSRGCDIYDFRSPLEPMRTVHLAIPELDIAFVTSDKFTQFETQIGRSVNLTRFVSDDIDIESKTLLSASKIMKLSMDEAFCALREAKALHDDLEDIYISAMDFSGLDKLTERYI